MRFDLSFTFSVALGLRPRAVPHVENLYVVRILMNTIEHDEGRVDDLPHAGASADNRSDVWKRPQQLDVIEDFISQALGRAGEMLPGVFNDPREVG